MLLFKLKKHISLFTKLLKSHICIFGAAHHVLDVVMYSIFMLFLDLYFKPVKLIPLFYFFSLLLSFWFMSLFPFVSPSFLLKSKARLNTVRPPGAAYHNWPLVGGSIVPLIQTLASIAFYAKIPNRSVQRLHQRGINKLIESSGMIGSLCRDWRLFRSQFFYLTSALSAVRLRAKFDIHVPCLCYCMLASTINNLCAHHSSDID